MEKLKQKAIKLGATDFGISNKPAKRFFVIYKGKKIDFGSDSRETFFDIRDKQKRKNWYARHSTNVDKSGKKFIQEKTSPLFWAAKMLW